MGANSGKPGDDLSLIGSVSSVTQAASSQLGTHAQRRRIGNETMLTTGENCLGSPDVFGSQWDVSISSDGFPGNMAADHVTRTFSDDNDPAERLDRVLQELDKDIESFSTEFIAVTGHHRKHDKATLPPLRGLPNCHENCSVSIIQTGLSDKEQREIEEQILHEYDRLSQETNTVNEHLFTSRNTQVHRVEISGSPEKRKQDLTNKCHRHEVLQFSQIFKKKLCLTKC
jgi:hypothetical protein